MELTLANVGRPIIVCPALITATGTLRNAIVLYRIYEESASYGDSEGWFHKPYTTWTKELFMSSACVWRSFVRLQELGLIEVETRKRKGRTLTYYRPNVDAICKLIEGVNVEE